MQISKLLPYARPYKKQLLLCPVAMVGEVAMETALPYLIAFMIDKGINAPGGVNMRYILIIGGVMLVMALLSLGFGALGARLSSVGSMGFAKCLRQAIFHKIQDFSFHNVDKFSTASLVTRLTTDVNNVQNTLMMLVRMAVRSPVMFLMATIMALVTNASLITIFLVAVPILLSMMAVIIKLSFPRFQLMMRKYDDMNKSVQENLIAIRVVKAFVRAAFEKTKFNKTADDVTAAQRSAEKIIIMTSPLMQVLMYSCTTAVLWFGGKLILADQMTTGQLTSYTQYISMILMSLMMLSFLFINFVLSKASVSRICEVLDETPSIQSKPDALKTVENGEIVFDHVGFSYTDDKNNLVLSDINLTIHAGETIGIIGGTGSAKTTLVSLIPRLYDVTCGRVLVGGHDVRDYAVDALRDKVAMVLQKNVLFSGSIESNLRWGNINATDEELREACRAAAADAFITSFPDSYKTDLGQGGVNVSGGQKQRLCIARALLKHPRILILDDATSAIDTATDASIRDALSRYMPDTTKLIIAQRITSVMYADRILVLEDGCVNGIGTHEALLANNAIYREVYTSQMKGDAA